MAGDLRERTGSGRPLFTVAEAATVCGADLIAGPAGEEALGRPVLTGVEVDSRLIRAGDLFCALPGEHVDGHDFIRQAFSAGAAVAMVSRDPGFEPPAGRAYLRVPDTLKGLADLARFHRDRFTLPVVAVTGSVGKTTTKDLTASVLGAALTVLANPGNLNTDIGLPLTLFELGPEHQAACLEMGMRGPGEIARLAALARPTVGVITNIGPVHIELLGSMEAITQAKEELLWALPDGGAAILNADDPIVAGLVARHRGRLSAVVGYGLGQGAEVAASDISLEATGWTRFRVTVSGAGAGRRAAAGAGPAGAGAAATGGDLGFFAVPLAGRHIVLDSLAAVAVGLHFGLDPEAIRRGLAKPRLSAMRQEVTELAGVRVINDAYNAGPGSMAASIELLAGSGRSRGGRTIAVLGDMLELGELSEQAHRDLGRSVARAGVDYLLLAGPKAVFVAEEAGRAGLAAERVRHFGETDPAQANASAAEELLRLVRPGDTVLIKASRGMKFETVAGALLEELKRRAGSAGVRGAAGPAGDAGSPSATGLGRGSRN